jgi:hypothetical protein
MTRPTVAPQIHRASSPAGSPRHAATPYCNSYDPETSPDNVSVRCEAIPDACLTDTTCECLTAAEVCNASTVRSCECTDEGCIVECVDI